MLVQICLAIIQTIKDDLLKMNMESALVYLKDAPGQKIINEDLIFFKAFEIKDVTRALLF